MLHSMEHFGAIVRQYSTHFGAKLDLQKSQKILSEWFAPKNNYSESNKKSNKYRIKMTKNNESAKSTNPLSFAQ